MTYKPFFFILFLLLSVNTVIAVDINIYYPNNNTTTDIYYSEADNYTYIKSNSILEKNLTSLIIKNQYESPDIISNPEKILDHTTVLLYIIIFVGIISMLIFVGIRVVKRL